MSDYDHRFGGIGRLYGNKALERLQRARVCVVGIGGVGSWSAEALARSGVGRLGLMDLDEVCVTNVNRQIHALDGTVGRSKAGVMGERIRAISPQCEIQVMERFFSADSADELLSQPWDMVVDAIDSVNSKCLLLAACRQQGIPVVTTGGAGGKRDPGQVAMADLSRVQGDRLIRKIRTRLRREYAFPAAGRKFGIDCVYSPEPQAFPDSDGGICDRPVADESLRLDCGSGFGTASFVTGTFGFMAAARAIHILLESAATTPVNR